VSAKICDELVVLAYYSSMSNYSTLRVAQLRDMCMQRGIDGVFIRKREVIEALRFDDDNRNGLGI